MHAWKIQSIAALSAASLFAQPLMVMPRAQACPVSHVGASQSPTVVPATLKTVASGVRSPMFGVATVVPITALSTAAIETQRSAIAEIMIELGDDEDRAQQMATQLTAEDLAVLLANPKMMQKAGDLMLIVAVLVIVGVVVALLIAADSSSVVVST